MNDGPPKNSVYVGNSYGLIIGDGNIINQNFNVDNQIRLSKTEILSNLYLVNSELRSYPSEIAGIHIKRSEIDEIINWALGNDESEQIAVLVDSPGGGKTVILRDMLVRLEEMKIPVLAIKTDQLSSGIKSFDDLSECIELSSPVDDCIRFLAHEGRVVVILDQLDALSLALTRDQTTLDTIIRLLAQLRGIENLRIIFSSRTFDLHNDCKLSRLPVNIKFQLQPLTESQVRQVLYKFSLDWNEFLPEHRRLLTTPLHLEIYIRLIQQESSKNFQNERFRSLQDLYEALWYKVIEYEPSDFSTVDERIRAIYCLVDYMQENHKLSAPIALLDGNNDGAKYLERNNLIHRERSSWIFQHQTFLDYCFARRFVAQTRSISYEILNGQQGLFERSLMIQVLAYLRGTNFEAYLKEFKSLLFSNKLRIHLRMLLFEWFGSISNPFDREISIARNILSNEESCNLLIKAISGNSGWFDVLYPHIFSIVHIKDDEVTMNLLIGYLSTMVDIKPQQVANFLRSYSGKNKQWDERIVFCLSFARRWENDHLCTLLYEIIKNGRGFGWTFNFFNFLSEINPGFGCKIIRAHLDYQISVVLGNTGKDARSEQMEKALFGNFGTQDLLRQALKTCPEIIVGELLPWIVTTVQKLSDEYPSDDYYTSDQLFSHGWFEEHATSAVVFIKIVSQALNVIAINDVEKLREIFKTVIAVNSLTIHRMIAYAYLSNPADFRDDIYLYLVSDPRRLNLGEYYDHYESCMLLAVAFESQNISRRKFLEEMILALNPNWERRNLGSSGRTQLQFLSNIPEHLLGLKGFRRLQELKNKFPEYRKAGPTKSYGGFVQAPISETAQKKMNDQAWLSAMRKYDDTTGWNSPNERLKRNQDILKGGIIELSRSLQNHTKSNPERFFNLARTFDNSISIQYITSIISGLAESECPIEWICDLIYRFSNRLIGKERNVISWAIQKRAKPGASEKVIELLCDWAVSDPDPSPEQEDEYYKNRANKNENEPYQFGINTVRGSALLAVVKCLLFNNPPQFERVLKLIENSGKDSSLAVRCCTLESIRLLINFNQKSQIIDNRRAIVLFREMIISDLDLLQQQFSENILYEIIDTDFLEVRELIEMMLESDDGKTCQAGARLACLSAFGNPDARDLVDSVICGNEFMCRGAAQVFSANVGNPKIRKTCLDMLFLFLHHPDEEVRIHAGYCFKNARPEDFLELKPFIEKFIDSACFITGVGHLVEFFGPIVCEDLELALKITENALDLLGSAIVDFRNAISIIEGNLVQLPLAVYTHTSDDEIRSNALDLFERLLLLDSSYAKNALNEWDRR